MAWEEQESASDEEMAVAPPENACRRGHRRSLALDTVEGGSICLPCFAALVSDPHSPTYHVSHALSQLTLAVRDPDLLRELRSCHAYFLVGPLVDALSVFDDEPLARQVMDLVSDLCFRCDAGGLSGVDKRCFTFSLSGDFIARIADRLASGALAWSQRQIYLLHCFGELLLSHVGSSPAAHIRDHSGLLANLLTGLQLPSEKICGEVLFVLYKLFLVNVIPWDEFDDDEDGPDFVDGARTLLRLALEILQKTQCDDVRMNCLALLKVLVVKGFHQNLLSSNCHRIYIKEMQDKGEKNPLITLFADALKGPLLSSNEEIQVNALDLIFLILSAKNCSIQQRQVLVEENIPDYIFEVIRLSGNKDPVVISSMKVLEILAATEEVFKQKLVVGFPTLLSVLYYTSEIPLYPVQPQILKLVCNSISCFPGIISISQVADLATTLTGILKRCIDGEHPETFILSCLMFSEILMSPSSCGVQKIGELIQDASRSAVLYSFAIPQGNLNSFITRSLSLLKAAHTYSIKNSDKELEKSIIITCQNYLLPWFQKVVDEEVDEGIVEAVLETFHLILLRGSDIQTQIFANNLVSSYWFNLSYAYLGLFPTDQMHSSIYLILGTIIDRTLGPEFGQPIRDACLYIPSDPLDLIFLLGQKSSLYTHLDLCQRAAFLILYVCSLYGERLAVDTQVLASLEQYLLINSSNFLSGIADALMLTQLVHLYGLIRGSPTGNMMQYSLEAEKILLNLLASEELDLFSISMHPIALKWLFQQEGITTSLSYLILKFCQIFGANESHFLVSSNGFRPLNIEMVAELVISADNYVAPLLISLLKELHEESREDDMTCLLNTLTAIVREFPDASNQFCLNSFACAIRCLYCSACCSSKVFIDCSLLVLNVLYAANNKMISQEGEWLAISMKLLEYVNPILVSQPWGQEARLVLSIFCLILHHSKSQVLEEASKAVLLSTSLASAIENIVQKACDKGSSLVDHDEETEIGECLTSVLLLYFFSLDSLQSNLEECFNWQELLQSSQSPPVSIFSIKCHDLCRLMHFGSSTVKLLSSKCLLSILGRISEQRRKQQEELSCSLRYLLSLIAIVEGLIFYEERIVATNCCLCLCIILNWESLELQEKLLIRNSKWLRIIMEELTMTLTAPIMASKYFKNQHKPASHVAAALIRLEKAPEWMRTVFDISCISGILGNLSAQNLTAEMVNLFRALLSKKYLNEDHIQRLSQLFQVCRNQVYDGSCRENSDDSLYDKFVRRKSDVDKACSLLIHLMLSTDCKGNETDRERLIEEIDMFFLEFSAQICYSRR